MTKTTNPTMIQMITIAFCAIIFMLIILITSGYSDTHYSTTATVSSVEDDKVTFVDGAGYVWVIYDGERYGKGQFVELKFYNNTTDYTREDDEIVKVKILDN